MTDGPRKRRSSVTAPATSGPSQTLTKKVEELHAIQSGHTGIATEYSRGIVTLSRDTWSALPAETPPKMTSAMFALEYEHMNELHSELGYAEISGPLIKAGLWMLGPENRQRLVEEIKSELSAAVFEALSHRLDPAIPGHDPFIIGLWAELFEEPLTDLWLAAMAYHAQYVGNEFAYGYLTAMLSQRKMAESDVIRGRKTMESSRTGGAARGRLTQAGTQRVLTSMSELIAKGHSVNRAAALTADRGVGTSSGANRKLWLRHKQS
jgi:hypothetical protein